MAGACGASGRGIEALRARFHCASEDLLMTTFPLDNAPANCQPFPMSCSASSTFPPRPLCCFLNPAQLAASFEGLLHLVQQSLWKHSLIQSIDSFYGSLVTQPEAYKIICRQIFGFGNEHLRVEVQSVPVTCPPFCETWPCGLPHYASDRNHSIYPTSFYFLIILSINREETIAELVTTVKTNAGVVIINKIGSDSKITMPTATREISIA